MCRITCQHEPGERQELRVAVPAASPRGKQGVTPWSPAHAGTLLRAAHSDLRGNCGEGLNTARAPHLCLSVHLQENWLLL